MSDNDNKTMDGINHYQDALNRYVSRGEEHKMLHCLEKLQKLPITVAHLEKTGVGRTVNALRKLDGEVGEVARLLVNQWKEMVEQDSQAETDKEDKETEESTENNSSHSDSANSSTDLKASTSSKRDHKEKHSEKNKSSSSSHSNRKSGEKYENGNIITISKSSNHDNVKCEKSESSRHGSSNKSSKRKIEDSSGTSDQELEIEPEQEPRKKHKTDKSTKESSYTKTPKHSERNSDHDKNKHRQKQRTSNPDRDESQKHRERDANNENRHSKLKKESVDSNHKDRRRDRSKEEAKDSKHKDRTKERPKDDKSKKEKHDDLETKEKNVASTASNSGKTNKSNGSTRVKALKDVDSIDSGSGASFAEALGMLEPTVNVKSVKKKSLKTEPANQSKKDIATSSRSVQNTSAKHKEKEKFVPQQDSSFLDDSDDSDANVPSLLTNSKLEPLDINISSLLPAITPNYRPVANSRLLENNPRQKSISEYETLSNVISSKNQRTKVYSGNKMSYGKIPSLFELCTRVLMDNIDALEYTGGVPYMILKPILDKCSPDQLLILEHFNPYLIEDTDGLWEFHSQKEFRSKKREEWESWREMYIRCVDEREVKLRALTANIKQSQDKSLPVRQTKLAYVDSVAKPPRSIAKKQAKSGYVNERSPLVTPSSRLSSIASLGSAGQVIVPNPGARTASSSNNNALMKIKKAPLMQKTLQLMKGRFRR